MAKGYGGRGMSGMGGGINMNMIKQAQKMQQDMQKMQSELEEKEYTASAGGGVVTAVVTGKRELKALTIDPEAVDPEDVEMLQDLIVASVNEAIPRRRDRHGQQYAKADRRAGPALLTSYAKSPPPATGADFLCIKPGYEIPEYSCSAP